MPARYLVIGAGAAAISAAEAIRSADSHGELTLLTEDAHGYYSRPGLAYYLTGEVSRPLLFPFKDPDWTRLAARRVLARATAIDPARHLLYLADGASLPYDRLLLATGASAIRPVLPGADLPEVVKLDTLEDADRMISLSKRSRAAVVIGGGITALEIVEGLRPHCRRIHYLMRGDRYWSNVLDEAESRLVLGRLEHDGIQIHKRTEAAMIQGNGGHVAAVLTTGGDQIACELVAVAIGVSPRTELAQRAGLAVDRGILVNEYLQARVPGGAAAADIFAAGDVAQVYDPHSGKALLDTLWSAARGQGTAAGHNMAGGSVRYVKPVALNVTRLAGITTTIIGAVGSGRDADLVGIARGDSEAWRGLGAALVAETQHEVNRLRLLVGPSTLVGAVLMGDQVLSRPLQRLIGGSVDITPIRSRLLAPGAPLAQILTEFANANQRA